MRRFTAVMGWGHSAGPDVLGGALQLWLPVDRFDEGMLLLRHTLRWELIDITYTVLFDSRRHAAARWDGKLIKPTPKVSSLEPALVQRIAELNHLDGLLYGASVAAFEAGLAAARGAPGSVERVAWDADAAEFAAMQRALKRSFSVADESPACAELKAWYTLSDLQYEVRARALGRNVLRCARLQLCTPLISTYVLPPRLCRAWWGPTATPTCRLLRRLTPW